jgi:hypothetical protein
VPYWQNIRWLQ